MSERNKKIIYEVLNSTSHGIGVVLGVIFLIMMICKFGGRISNYLFVGFIIYGVCFILMFLSSTLYHGIQTPKFKKVLRVFDHSSIFLFIAGSYTPIVLYILEGRTRLLFLTAVWAAALFGTLFKILTYNKYDKYIKLSVFLYIAMGWMTIFLIKPIIFNTGVAFVAFILMGGILYTVGTYFYKRRTPLYNHFVWHIFVLAAAVVQYIGISNFLI
ncbi:MAG: hemolysin III family protein [Peptoniphilus sp.]|nr:hemolysin III family protein [Peptoniphilus sp.]